MKNELIALVGVVLSFLSSLIISRYTANKEIKKLRLSWKREDNIAAENEFSEMAAAVAKYIQVDSPPTRSEASAKVAAFRAKERGDMAIYLDELYSHIARRENEKADALLTRVIQCKREEG